MGPRAGLDGCEKSRPTPAFDPQTVQFVASRYTDCAIPAPTARMEPTNSWKLATSSELGSIQPCPRAVRYMPWQETLQPYLECKQRHSVAFYRQSKGAVLNS